MTELVQIDTGQPRARGDAELSVRRLEYKTVIDRLRQSGSLRLLFPRCDKPHLQVVLVNTAGGLTGGDRFGLELQVDQSASLTLTTQAAERAYRAQPGQTAFVVNDVRIAEGAHLSWLPQEIILFDGCALRRRLTIDLCGNGSCLLVEPIVFGRRAMGEVVSAGQFSEHIEIRREGELIYLDKFRLAGDFARHLDRPATAKGATALASIVLAAPLAEAYLEPLRSLLPENAGASLVREDLLVCRVLAEDSHELRKVLIPAIELLTKTAPPRPWMI